MKRTKTEQVYEMNRDTTVAIKSKKIGEEYTHKIVLTHIVVSKQALTPQSQEEVAELVAGIDLEDDQLDLLKVGAN